MNSKLKLAFSVCFLILAGCSLLQVGNAENDPNGTTSANENNKKNILVIAHRGASGYRPEHTLAAYELAIEMGADFIEPDLVSTKDGVLIARHENEISETTDAAQKFPDRKTKKYVDGELKEGWFTEDFTFREIKTLKAKQRRADRSHDYDGQYEVPAFAEILDMLRKKERETGRIIGIYSEIKHPAYFNGLKLALEERLVTELNRYGFKNKEDAVFVQSFEPESLKKVKKLAPFKLIQLIEDQPEKKHPYDFAVKRDFRTYRDLLSESGLKDIKTYADGIGPPKCLLLKQPLAGSNCPPLDLVTQAHKAGLLVHTWVFRSDVLELPERYHGNPIEEYLEYYKLGVDAVFSDFPDVAVAARNRLQ